MCKAEQHNEKRYIQQASIDARNDLRGARMLRQYCLDSIPRPVVARGATWSDCLLSGLSVFSLKIPSWRKFDELFRLNERTVRARNYNAQSAPEFRFSGLVGLL